MRKYTVCIIILFSFFFAYSAEADWEKIKSEANQKKIELLQKTKTYRKTSIPLLIIGPLLTGAGFGLFLHDKAFNGENSPSAQYSLMFTGLSLIGTGVTLNYYSEYDKNRYNAYDDISKKQFDPNTTINIDNLFAQAENQAKKLTVKTLRIHGTTLILLSIPLLALSVYSIVETWDYWEENRLPGPNIIISPFITGFIFLSEIHNFFFGIASLTGGIIMLAKASKYEKLSTEPSLLTLNSITPMINPVSKTYGLALGFSF